MVVDDVAVDPNLCGLALVSGAGGLAWYQSLSKDEQEEADKHAKEIAWNLYQKSVKNLARDQAENVAAMVKRRMSA